MEHADGIFLSKMMERERAENEIVRFGCAPFQNVAFDETDFRIIAAQLSSDLLVSYDSSMVSVSIRTGSRVAPP